MVREHALLPVIPGQEDAFEAALAEALPLISGSPGFVRLTVSRGIESPSNYLLLVEWESLTAHTVGFRGSPEYDAWRGLLHRFYDPAPQVEHFADVVATDDGVRTR